MSRFSFPVAYDPQMRREEDLTLSRTTSSRNGIPKASTEPIASNTGSPGNVAKTESSPHRRRLVFTDPVAFRYLEDDTATVVLERRGRVSGYELYAVEQWACSRVHPTFVITTYTGDPNHSVLAGVLGVPADEESWSPRLRVYFNAISQFHARPKETPLGTLMITNLSAFPSALTVISVPGGDVKKHREDFIVNENLKRLGCSGRSGLSLSTPTGATQAKFHQLYKTSDQIPLYSAVIELVKLCQVALMIFGKLEQEYADGLLCDVTERAINDWWTDIGSEYYNLEPSDGILGPTTVAGLLGLLMGSRNRLSYYGAPVAKDVFDIASLKRGIAYFQKAQRLDRTRRLDRQTLASLHRATAKAAAGEGWGVPKALKSGVVELGGKGGEMVMGMVGGGRDKAAMGDIETLDIEDFVALVHGERSKWLWHGKARKTGTGEFGKSVPEMGNMIFGIDNHGGYVWSSARSNSVPQEDDESMKRDSGQAVYSAQPPSSTVSVAESPGELRKTVLKSVTDKMSDARSGFGRIKDAVGLRGHVSRPSKDYMNDGDVGYFGPATSNFDPRSSTNTTPGVAKAFSWKNKPEEYQNGFRKDFEGVEAARSTDPARGSESSSVDLPKASDSAPPFLDISTPSQEAEARWSAQVKEIRRDLVISDPSVAASVYDGGDLNGPLLEAERDPDSSAALLLRRHSLTALVERHKLPRHDGFWPRHLSFSEAEVAVLPWEPVGVLSDNEEEADTWENLRKQHLIAGDLRELNDRVSALQKLARQWVTRKVDSVQDLETKATQDQDEFQALYYQLSDAYQSVQLNSQDIIAEERSRITEAVKDIEVLGAKLEYEINGLVSKVQEVEEGVTQFEGQVKDLENRALELEEVLSNDSWYRWAVKTISGFKLGGQKAESAKAAKEDEPAVAASETS